ncbi:amino acid-binding protein [Methanobrevibacter filiformis]|uniref:Threonine dehydratase n=1 Tax=Methanobrevibacter filiformis TaxID=55758 RepID=A0A166FDZ9_9EURY|nr:amino acid-binding protein [Methanobrevibacter filiformis]KZX17578.1 threonine dehydratase [Methanobrevibacter filiformis]
MKMNLVLELQDIPGQLVSVLSPISSLGTNLVTVIHKREDKNERGLIPVQITLEGEQNNLNAVISKLNEMQITILEVDGVILREKLTTILIGHVIDTNVKDTMDKINGLTGVSIVDFEVKLAGELESSAKLVVESDFGMKKKVLNKIQEIALEKNFLVVSEV